MTTMETITSQWVLRLSKVIWLIIIMPSVKFNIFMCLQIETLIRLESPLRIWTQAISNSFLKTVEQADTRQVLVATLEVQLLRSMAASESTMPGIAEETHMLMALFMMLMVLKLIHQ